MSGNPFSKLLEVRCLNKKLVQFIPNCMRNKITKILAITYYAPEITVTIFATFDVTGGVPGISVSNKLVSAIYRRNST